MKDMTNFKVGTLYIHQSDLRGKGQPGHSQE